MHAWYKILARWLVSGKNVITPPYLTVKRSGLSAVEIVVTIIPTACTAHRIEVNKVLLTAIVEKGVYRTHAPKMFFL